MVKKVQGLSLSVVIIFSLVWPCDQAQGAPSPEERVWRKANDGIREAEVNQIAVTNETTPVVFAGTGQAVYRSGRGVTNYLSSLYLEKTDEGVNELYVDPGDLAVYAASDTGVFVSRDLGSQWRKIYFAKKSLKERCYSVVTYGPWIVIGTSRGIFYSDKRKIQWSAVGGYLQNKEVQFLQGDGNFIYAGLRHEVFRLDEGLKDAQRVFCAGLREGADDEPAEGTDEFRAIRVLLVPPQKNSRLYVVATKGVFLSDDCGESFAPVNHDGLDLDEVRAAALAEGTLFLAGNRGVFCFHDGAWKAVYQGAETSHFNDLVSDGARTLYAATDKGIFTLAPDPGPRHSAGPPGTSANVDLSWEPTIQEVHRMAMDYAQVDPAKIKDWQRRVEKKAWLPSLSMGLGSDKNKTLSDSIYGTYSGGGQSYVGPRDKTFYDNFGWDVSLSWDLGDLIWNADQTSIDSRAKLLTELRQDILNEVTRLYFERRRLQGEITQDAGLGDENEKKMRLEELTALIDALTGGAFSREINNRGEHGNAQL